MQDTGLFKNIDNQIYYSLYIFDMISASSKRRMIQIQMMVDCHWVI